MAANADFAHLHVHTEYSMLDGATRLDGLFEEANRLGQKSIAITDHGYMFGAFDFYKKAKAADIKPIIGVEAYLTPGTARSDKTRVTWGTEAQKDDDVSARGAYTHMTLLSRNNTGMHNLFRMASLASLDGQMGKAPRMDRELLQTYGEGLIGTTGCASGEIQTRLRLGQYDEARQAAAEFQDIFGKENFYVELMRHGIDVEQRTFADLITLAKDIGAPLLATNDLHYTTRADAKIQEYLLCINSGSTMSEPPKHEGGSRFAFEGHEFYLKSAQEMRDLFSDYPEACDNTLLVAEQCDVSFNTSANYMPVYPVPAGESEESWFIKEVEIGLQRRYPGGVPDNVRKQAEYEIGVILKMGFPSYFLVVADFINWAKERSIAVGPGRGSGAGSMVAYAMRITDLDPLVHGLYFERFLNPERVSMPDFDIDFDERRRDEVIDYVVDQYGDDKVAQVVTYGTIGAKGAIKDAARVLDKEYRLSDTMTKAMPPMIMGKDIPLSGIYDKNHPRYAEATDFRNVIETTPGATEVIDTARNLEGIKRQWGVHAAAVIMSSETLTDLIPVMRRPQDGAVITQFDFPACEELGLLKMDFLGLRNLTVLSDAIANITVNGKQAPDLETLDLDDPAAYELLSRGDTLGVFQLDSPGMRTLLRQLRPDHFEDISAVQALYRPGPMGADSHTNYARRKNGLQKVDPIHPELAEPLADILDTTYGLIVYQEQVMAIAQKVASYSLGQADLLRRAMGKKKKEELDRQYVDFEAGMKKNGYSAAAVTTLWNLLLPFSDYAFNKAHSAAYGLVSYWTAYLKANFPVEYMAALLTSTPDNKDRLAIYLAEARHMNITVLPPDINTSEHNFTPVRSEVRFGLGAIRNVGRNVVDAIVQTRQAQGEFTSFEDFLSKVPIQVCNRRTIDSLIKAGAFDSLGYPRRALQAIHEEAVNSVVGVKRQEAIGQFDLFGDMSADDDSTGLNLVIPDLPEWDKKEKLAQERDMLGLYVSDHPLAGLEHALSNAADHPIARLKESGKTMNDARIKIAGLITAVDKRHNKNGQPWATVTVEDTTGSIDVRLFARSYEQFGHLLAPDTIAVVNGRVQTGDESIAIIGRDVSLPDLKPQGAPVEVSVPARLCSRELVTRIKDVLTNHPGSSPVRLLLTDNGSTTHMAIDPKYNVEGGAPLHSDLKAILGASAVT